MNNLDVIPVNQLIDENFWIPAYQRGYRWSKESVQNLLDDIWEFVQRPKQNINEFYCLQPIVVKKVDNAYEVIDGQQRLTTIFLILKHLEQFIESDRKLFDIQYETREKSSDFLKNIDNKTEKEAEKNIDFFYIFYAFHCIEEWFKQKANEGYSSISSKFISPFLEKTKVIWYEVDEKEKDPVKIFTRLNIGKIPLTNAELIKALFLNTSNFNTNDPEKIKIKQLEIASEWDDMEYSLRDNEFWYFLNNKENPLANRIEYIFQLMEDNDKGQAEKDGYSTFKYFSEEFEKINNSENPDGEGQKEKIDAEWHEVKKLYQKLKDWFLDKILYHKIGYLIATGTDIKEIIKDSENENKSSFEEYLNSLIAKKINCENIDELEYGDSRIKPIFLLHNIQTIINNTNESYRFSFYKYKTEKWDIEHIHAVSSELPESEKEQKEWLNVSKEFVSDELKQKIEEFNEDSGSDDFDQLAKEILYEYSENNHLDDHNDISNLVLLDAGTNRRYGNALFPVKRQTIIDKDKAGEFLPVCTKNVFLKYYSKKVDQISLWQQSDKDAYLEDIKCKLKDYLQA